MPDFLPRRGSELLSFTRNIDQRINADPAKYSLSPDEAAEYTVLCDQFAEAYQLVNQNSTDTSVAYRQKLDSEKALREKTREICGRIRVLLTLSAAEKSVVGIRPRKRFRSRIPAPTVAPLVRVDFPQGRSVVVRVIDKERPLSTAKPQGVQGAYVYYAVGNDYPADERGWQFVGGTSVSKMEFTFPTHLAPGTQVWITARWANARGMGPVGAPMYTHVGHGVQPIKNKAA